MKHSNETRRGMLIAAIVALAVSLPAFGQGPGGGGGGTGGGGTGGGGGGTGGTGGGGGGTGGGGTGGLGGGLGGGGLGAGRTAGGASGASGSSSTANLGTGAVNARNGNYFSQYNLYPYVTGLPATDTGAAGRSDRLEAQVQNTFPAFGGTTMSASRTTTGTQARRGGTATVRGGAAGRSTGTGEGFDAGPSGGQMTRTPHYAASLRFKGATVTPEMVLSDVKAVIDRSSSIASKDKLQISVQGRDVVLRGNVGSDDERRHIEGLVRLTPGVGAILNELVVKE